MHAKLKFGIESILDPNFGKEGGLLLSPLISLPGSTFPVSLANKDSDSLHLHYQQLPSCALPSFPSPSSASAAASLHLENFASPSFVSSSPQSCGGVRGAVPAAISPSATSSVSAPTGGVIGSQPPSASSSSSSPLLLDNRNLLPSWIFCTRYSDRPSAGPRCRKPRKREASTRVSPEDEKRPRTAFTASQLDRLKKQFTHNRYLTEKRRQELAHELGLNESQIKIWFQNKRAKLKKSTNATISTNLSMQQLFAQGIYNSQLA